MLDFVAWVSPIISWQDAADLGGWSQELLFAVPGLVDLFLYSSV